MPMLTWLSMNKQTLEPWEMIVLIAFTGIIIVTVGVIVGLFVVFPVIRQYRKGKKNNGERR